MSQALGVEIEQLALLGWQFTRHCGELIDTDRLVATDNPDQVNISRLDRFAGHVVRSAVDQQVCAIGLIGAL